jgi:hypothetical protein
MKNHELNHKDTNIPRLQGSDYRYANLGQRFRIRNETGGLSLGGHSGIVGFGRWPAASLL